jgi:HK97 family phage major capsid protein
VVYGSRDLISPENSTADRSLNLGGFTLNNDERRLREQRVSAWNQMQSLMANGGNLSAAEGRQYDKAEGQLRGAEHGLRELGVSVAESRDGGAAFRGTLNGGDTDPSSPRNRSYSHFLRTGEKSAEMRASNGISTSPNNGQTGTDEGGYAIAQAFWQNLEVALKAYGGLANDFKQIESETGAPMPWPGVDPTAAVASIVGSQITQLSPASPYVFGQGQLNAWTFATAPVLASIEAAQDWAFDLDSFLADRLGEQLGRAIAGYSVTGTGSGQPLGLITARRGVVVTCRRGRLRVRLTRRNRRVSL